MQINEAIEYMMNAASERAYRFDGLGLTVRVERDLMDKTFSPTEKERAAKYITVSIVILAEDGGSEDEYALSLGAEVKHGRVDENELSGALAEFDGAIGETVSRLTSATDITEEISRLCRESEAEYDVFLTEVKKSAKKQMIRSLVFSAIIILLMAIMSLVTKYAAG